MKVSTKSRYAIKLMLDIAENEHKGNVSVRDVSQRTGIPLKYLEQIVGILCKTGFVKSHRGAQGGYTLSPKCDSCTMGDIIRTMEGDISDDYIEDDETVKDFWRQMYVTINSYMDSVTLEDIIEKEKSKNGVYEYYI